MPPGFRWSQTKSRNSTESRLVTLARKYHVVFETIASKWRPGFARNQRRPSSVTIVTLGLLSSEATCGERAINARYPGLISTTVSEATSGLLAMTCAHDPVESPIINTLRGAG